MYPNRVPGAEGVPEGHDNMQGDAEEEVGNVEDEEDESGPCAPYVYFAAFHGFVCSHRFYQCF